MRYSININGKNYDVEIKKVDDNFVAPAPIEQPKSIPTKIEQPIAASIEQPVVVSATKEDSNVEVVSPMPGAILSILVDIGQQVSEGEAIIILEAMKMEIEVNAPKTGVIKQVLVNVGSSVGANDVLIVMN
ncbi:biotin/lipoyl-containing protein [Cetobacterium sp.]|uniref:biotin/lipoyl-containing protein n=1 Tax=Cetobacterium sp. TaxID=2071632 RepID=UPI003EE54210